MTEPPEDLFTHLDDPTLRPTAEQVHRVLHAGLPRPAFRTTLRTHLLAAHAQTHPDTATPHPDSPPTTTPTTPEVTAVLPQAASPAAGTGTGTVPVAPVPPPSRAIAGWRRRELYALAAAVVATILGTAAVIRYVIDRPAPVSVTAVGDVAGAVSAAPGDAVRLRFTQALDPGSTRKALRLVPATDVTTTWQGATLTVSARHGFAPNTPYRLVIDHDTARTANGAPIAADIRLVWGTAPTPGPAPTAGPPATLTTTTVAGATDGAEAVVTGDGALLVTGAQPGPDTDFHSGLVRIDGGGSTRLAPETDAICLSRSGASVAYLSGTQIVFADKNGTAQDRVAVPVDAGSPLGWINDAEVTYVGGGRLRAVDRAGHVRTLADSPLDPTRDTLVIAPGGRYVYLRTTGPGELIDLPTGARHQLPGATDNVAFSPDGATVLWLDGTRLATAPSAGGPVLTASLPVGAGDKVSDLAVSPTGGRLAYSVTHPDGQGELRVAALPDGHTIGASTAGTGESPNWAPSGRTFTVLAGGSRIESVTVPPADPAGRVAATAAAFANAQVGGDPDAQQALAGPDLLRPALPPLTRAAVLWVSVAPDGSATARVRLTSDSGPVQSEETLTLDTRVRAVSVEPFHPVPPGPQLIRATAGSLTFDSDLDPASVPRAFQEPATYDPATRTVTVKPAGTVIRVSTALRDVNGQPLGTPLSLPV
jgi:Bacterial Ig-like domain